MTDAQHEEVTAVMTRQGPYGTGVTPNPYAAQVEEWQRRKRFSAERALITAKIESLFEPRFITPPETSECIESIVTMTDSRRILEVGTCTGFTTLHILRAIIGKEGAHVTSIDGRPAHDEAWFTQPTIAPWFRFVKGFTPGILQALAGELFDLIFIDSDHSLEHTQVELAELIQLSKPDTIFIFHDLPEWMSPGNKSAPPVRSWLLDAVAKGSMYGLILPTAEQLDCKTIWGAGYPKQAGPHLGVFVRR